VSDPLRSLQTGSVIEENAEDALEVVEVVFVVVFEVEVVFEVDVDFKVEVDFTVEVVFGIEVVFVVKVVFVMEVVFEVKMVFEVDVDFAVNVDFNVVEVVDVDLGTALWGIADIATKKKDKHITMACKFIGYILTGQLKRQRSICGG